MPHLLDDSDDYIDNPAKTIRGIKRHPLRWSRQVLSLMGVPDIIPIVPITSTPISGFPDTVIISGLYYSIENNLALIPNYGRVPFYHLRNFVPIVVDWCHGKREAGPSTTQIELKLQIGDQRHYLKSLRVIYCRTAAFMAYIDASLRSTLRGLFQGVPIREFERLSAAAQKDDALDPYDFAILIALAQDQKFGGIKPAGGIYTSRVFYPNSSCDEMIFITARIPEETVAALENNELRVRKVDISMSTVPFGSNGDWTESGFLKTLLTLMTEIRLAADSTLDSEDEPESSSEPEESYVPRLKK